MGKEFTCDRCGGEFVSGWTDAEAEAEAQAMWGDLAPEERSVLCDDCFQKMTRWAREQGLLQ